MIDIQNSNVFTSKAAHTLQKVNKHLIAVLIQFNESLK
jgi:hypothetical protein